MKLALIFVLTFSVTAFTQTTPDSKTIVLLENNTINKSLIIATNSAQNFKTGDQLIYNYRDGRQCYFNITEIAQDFLIASTENCPFSNELKKGAQFSESISNKLSFKKTIETTEPVKVNLIEPIPLEKLSSDYKKTIQVNVLQLKGESTVLKSLQRINGSLLFQIKDDERNFKSIPLDFRFELENKNWGILSDVNLPSELGDVGVYKKFKNMKIGAGVLISHSSSNFRVDVNGTSVASSIVDTKETRIAPYFLFKAFDPNQKDDNLEVWIKAGADFTSMKDGTSEISYTALFINPGIDYFFNLSGSTSIGAGVSLYFAGITGELKSSNTTLEGEGTSFNYNINFLKMRFNF